MLASSLTSTALPSLPYLYYYFPLSLVPFNDFPFAGLPFIGVVIFVSSTVVAIAVTISFAVMSIFGIIPFVIAMFSLFLLSTLLPSLPCLFCCFLLMLAHYNMSSFADISDINTLILTYSCIIAIIFTISFAFLSTSGIPPSLLPFFPSLSSTLLPSLPYLYNVLLVVLVPSLSSLSPSLS